MALAIVVWFIAGMSLLVASTVSVSRSDVQMAQIHVTRARVAAAGDGAIQLALAQTILGKPGDAAAESYRVGDLDFKVTLVPVSLLVNMNEASEALLARFFQALGGDEATKLAHAVVEWRRPLKTTSPAERGGQFYSVEDLLRVDGMSRSMLDRLRDYVVAGTWARGGSKMENLFENWSLSPEAGSRETIDAALAGPGADALKGAIGKASGGKLPGSGVYRVDAVVKFGDVRWIRRRWVSMSPGQSSALPWKFVRTEAPRVYNGPDGLGLF